MKIVFKCVEFRLRMFQIIVKCVLFHIMLKKVDFVETVIHLSKLYLYLRAGRASWCSTDVNSGRQACSEYLRLSFNHCGCPCFLRLHVDTQFQRVIELS